MRNETSNLEDLRRRADRGDAAAQFEFGMQTLHRRGHPGAYADGVRRILEAAAREHPPALCVAAVFAATGIGRDASWSDAFETLQRAAALGDRFASAQLEVIGDTKSLGARLGPHEPSAVLDSPRASVIPGLVPVSWCNWLIERGRNGRSRARVYKKDGFGIDNERTNTCIDFSIEQTDLVMQLINARIANMIGVPRSYHEPPSILHYEVGQEFKPHVDYLDARDDFAWAEIQKYGQRALTVLVYLNESYEGGETSFVDLNWGFRGGVGDALMFWNVTPEGRADPASRHAGLAPTSGEKWLLSKWIRDKALPED